MCQLNVLTKLIILLQFLSVSKAEVVFDTVQTFGSKCNLGLDWRQGQPTQGSVASTDWSAGNMEKCPRGQCTLSIIHRRCVEGWELTA